MSPKRSRLISGDFILDIVETNAQERWYYYMVHAKSTGDILTLGHERSWEAAEQMAIWSVKQITGKDPGFKVSEGAA